MKWSPTHNRKNKKLMKKQSKKFRKDAKKRPKLTGKVKGAKGLRPAKKLATDVKKGSADRPLAGASSTMLDKRTGLGNPHSADLDSRSSRIVFCPDATIGTSCLAMHDIFYNLRSI